MRMERASAVEAEALFNSKMRSKIGQTRASLSLISINLLFIRELAPLFSRRGKSGNFIPHSSAAPFDAVARRTAIVSNANIWPGPINRAYNQRDIEHLSWILHFSQLPNASKSIHIKIRRRICRPPLFVVLPQLLCFQFLRFPH